MKKLIVVILMLLSLYQLQAQQKFPDYLVRYDATKPLIYTDQLGGGYWQVFDSIGRNAIPIAKRARGMAVSYVASGNWITKRFEGSDTTNTEWLDYTNWVEIGGGGIDTNNVIKVGSAQTIYAPINLTDAYIIQSPDSLILKTNNSQSIVIDADKNVKIGAGNLTYWGTGSSLLVGQNITSFNGSNQSITAGISNINETATQSIICGAGNYTKGNFIMRGGFNSYIGGSFSQSNLQIGANDTLINSISCFQTGDTNKINLGYKSSQIGGHHNLIDSSSNSHQIGGHNSIINNSSNVVSINNYSKNISIDSSTLIGQQIYFLDVTFDGSQDSILVFNPTTKKVSIGLKGGGTSDSSWVTSTADTLKTNNIKYKVAGNFLIKDNLNKEILRLTPDGSVVIFDTSNYATLRIDTTYFVANNPRTHQNYLQVNKNGAGFFQNTDTTGTNGSSYQLVLNTNGLGSFNIRRSDTLVDADDSVQVMLYSDGHGKFYIRKKEGNKKIFQIDNGGVFEIDSLNFDDTQDTVLNYNPITKKVALGLMSAGTSDTNQWHTALNWQKADSTLKFGTSNNKGFGLYTNNLNRMWLNGNGNVGLGTQIPTAKLQVVSGSIIACKSATSFTTTYPLSVQNNSTSAYMEILNSGGAGKGAFFGMAGNNFEIWNYQAGDIHFYTSTATPHNNKAMSLTTVGYLEFSGEADRVIKLIRNTTTSGNNLSVSAGGGKSGGISGAQKTNGGDLILNNAATTIGKGKSAVRIGRWGTSASAPWTSDNTYYESLRVNSTNNPSSATNDTLFSVVLGADSTWGAVLEYAVRITDNDSLVVETGRVEIKVIKLSGVITGSTATIVTSSQAVRPTTNTTSGLTSAFNLILSGSTVYVAYNGTSNILIAPGDMKIDHTILTQTGLIGAITQF